MNRLLASLACAVALAACGEQQSAKPAAVKPGAAAPALPATSRRARSSPRPSARAATAWTAAASRRACRISPRRTSATCSASLKAYKDGKRGHAALKVITERMSEADIRNVAAYYAGLPASGIAPAKDASHASPYEAGKARAAACAKCHGEDGNGTAPGIPSLAGQQAQLPGRRAAGVRPRRAQILADALGDAHAFAFGHGGRGDLLRLACAGRARRPGRRRCRRPARRLSAVCSGCHGLHGVSGDSMTPNLAGQDYGYLVQAIKAYRTTRKREKMRLYITGLGRKGHPEHRGLLRRAEGRRRPSGARPWCRTWSTNATAAMRRRADNPAMVVPKIAGQDRDYLVMAIRAYRDDRRAEHRHAHHEPALRQHRDREHRLVLRQSAGEVATGRGATCARNRSSSRSRCSSPSACRSRWWRSRSRWCSTSAPSSSTRRRPTSPGCPR